MLAKMKSIGFKDIFIDSGFWNKRQSINSETSIYSVWERFKDTGRFDALNFDWKEGCPNKPHIFWDSDIAKWVESAAYILAKRPDKVLERAIDDIVDLIGSDIQINVGCWVVLDELSKPKRFFIESQASFSLNYSIVEEWV